MKITEDDFHEIYKPQKNHLDDNAGFGGEMYETYDEEVQYVFELSKNTKRVWTILEGDEGICYVAGFWRINRLGYFVTEKEWETGEEFVDVDEDFD